MNLLCWPVRMHIASVGVSKICFLFSLLFCGLLLFFIPSFQPSARHVNLPQPRRRIRPTQVGSLSHPRDLAVHVDGAEKDSATGLNWSLLDQGGTREAEDGEEDTVDDQRSQDRWPFSRRKGSGLSLSHDPLVLKDIFIAVKTTRKYHKSRLELLIQTWVSQAKEQVSRAELHTTLYNSVQSPRPSQCDAAVLTCAIVLLTAILHSTTVG